MEEIIKRELGLYSLREIEIEDMKLKIEEMKVGEQLGAMGFEERVQTSLKCKNNDYVMNKIDMLEKRIKLSEIANKRIDNSLKVLDIDEKEVIKKIFIDNKSISRTSQELFRSRKSVVKTIERAIKKIKLA
jgi:DNA-directed RNA polymerase specialized sigma24 family protein